MCSDIAHDSGRRLAYLDGWRGLCILAVLAGCFLPFHTLKFDDLDVKMFVVLGGRLVVDILFVEKFALPAFYFRRFPLVWPRLAVYVHMRPMGIAAARRGGR